MRPLPEKGPAAVSGPAAAAAEGDLGDDPVDAAACACRRWVYLSNSACALFGAAGFGVVLYNVGLAGIAVALLILSLARRAPAPE